VWITAAEVPFRDEIMMIKGGPVESYLNGTLTFADLWRPMSSERYLGYNLLQIINVKFFAMNSKNLALLIPFFMLASAILIYREYRESIISYRSHEFIAVTFFIITCIIFNLIQYEGLIFSFALTFQYSMPFLIGSFICTDLYLSKDLRKYWLSTFILPILAILVFGATKVLPFTLALGATLCCHFLSQRHSLPKNFRFRMLSIIILFAVIGFLYLYRLTYNNYMPFSPSSYILFIQAFIHPLEASRFLFASFGASVIGVDAFYACNFLSFGTMILIGAFVALLYVLSLFLFFRSRMYERTYLPFFLIMLTFFFLLVMTVARFPIGMGVGMASHYTCVSIYGIVAMVWIFIFRLTQPMKQNVLLKGLLFTSVTVIFTGLILTSIVVCHLQPQRKAYFEQLRHIAAQVDTADIYELWKFTTIGDPYGAFGPTSGEIPEAVRDSLRLLRENKLNVYRNSQ
jgi:hypothetical protein